jgi:catechol 2,3-dioxygenase-like lactoylglutathione lyase family enzyme
MPKSTNNCLHVAIRVKDYAASMRFYRDVLGFEEMFSLTMKDYYDLLGGSAKNKEEEERIWLTYLRIRHRQHFEIFPVYEGKVDEPEDTHSFFHFSFQVDDIVRTVNGLRRRGVRVYRTHSKDSEVAAEDDFVPLRAPTGSLIAWTRDPDGNLINLMQLTDECLERTLDHED